MWNLKLDLVYGGDEYHLDFTMSEQGIIAMLKLSYNALEGQLKQLMTAGSGKAPSGAVDDAMVLIRCMTNSRLEEHSGQILKIKKLRGKS